jgi:hypothetical protein
MSGPVESKVKAATFGAAVAGVGVWALETYVFHGSVPLPIQALIDIAVPGVCAFVLGWAAKHTPRTDPGATVPPGPR